MRRQFDLRGAIYCAIARTRSGREKLGTRSRAPEWGVGGGNAVRFYGASGLPLPQRVYLSMAWELARVVSHSLEFQHVGSCQTTTTLVGRFRPSICMALGRIQRHLANTLRKIKARPVPARYRLQQYSCYHGFERLELRGVGFAAAPVPQKQKMFRSHVLSLLFHL